jgi:hypothetical protein
MPLPLMRMNAQTLRHAPFLIVLRRSQRDFRGFQVGLID